MNPLSNNRIGLPLAVLLIGISSCTSFKTFRRYNSAGSAIQLKDDTLADIDLFMVRIDSTSKKDEGQNLWKLSDHGQAELIRAFNKRDTANDKFLKSLNNTYLKKSNDGDPIDLIDRNLTMVFTISRKRPYQTLGEKDSRFSPADRIEYLWYELTLPDSARLTFKKWNRYTTEYGSVDIGDVSFSRSLSGTAGFGDSGISISPYINATGTLSDSQSQHIKYRFLQMNGEIKDHNRTIRIEEEGEREIDLTGNVIANVSCEFKPETKYLFSISSLQDDDNQFNKPEKVSVNVLLAQVPKAVAYPEKIQAKLTLTYVYRHVQNFRGQRTYYEWDDKVRYYTGTIHKDVTVFYKKDYLPDFAFIGKKGQDTIGMGSRFQLVMQLPLNQSQLLLFQSYQEARSFYTWLTNYAVQEGSLDTQITIGGYKLRWLDGDKNGPVTKQYLRDSASALLAVPLYNK
jgi:hypothetical protein